ncbi:MAG: serine hydrolase domain-containing protein [Myxococcota bacterium]
MGQELKSKLRREIVRLLEAGVSGRAFPGASACVGWREGDADVFVPAVAGRVAPDGPAVEEGTPYDLASLTKPLVAMAALRMVVAGKVTLDARADSLVNDVRGGPGGAKTLEALLRHRAGLAAWGGLYLDVPHDPGTAPARRWILSEAARRQHEQDEPVVYSDLGYIIAGEMLARAAGQTLDQVVARYVTEPLGIDHEVYYAGALPSELRTQLVRRAAPTERCEWRGRLVRGEVHDENCAALGGVSGHAGMFGSARAVAAFGRTMLDVLDGRSDFLPPELLEGALADPGDGDTHRLGWDTKSAGESSAGRRMSANSFGHLGFTGTSIWCDRARDVVVVLLTNRVHPSRANEKIRGFRPAFHDGVLALLD